MPGLSRVSIPSVSCIGDVVSVSIDVPIIKRISLVPIRSPLIKPSQVTFRNRNWKMTRPSVINRCSAKVSTKITIRGLIPRSTNLPGILEARTTRAMARAASP